jgi:hypothetical protein
MPSNRKLLLGIVVLALVLVARSHPARRIGASPYLHMTVRARGGQRVGHGG